MLKVKNLQLFNNSFDLINFDINLGEGLCIDGGPGTGKTKLFKILTGLLRPISGEVYYQNISLYNSDFIDLGRLRKMVGAIFERPTIMSNLTLEQNIDFILKSRQASWDNFILDLIDKFELKNDLKERKLNLSKDAIIRFNLIKIMISKPTIIFLDELVFSKIKTANNYFFNWVNNNREGIAIVVFGKVAGELNEFVKNNYRLDNNSMGSVYLKNAS